VFKVLRKREKITEERIKLLRSWKHSGFRVFSERRVNIFESWNKEEQANVWREKLSPKKVDK